MPIHDWSKVNAATFHDFHNTWIVNIKSRLNDGLLPDGYYAMSEQHAGRVIADVLALEVNEPTPVPFSGGGGAVAVADSPPKVSRKLVAPPEAAYRLARLGRCDQVGRVAEHWFDGWCQASTRSRHSRHPNSGFRPRSEVGSDRVE